MNPENHSNRQRGKREQTAAPEEEKQRILRKRILILAVVAAAVVIALVITYNLMFRRPDPNTPDPDSTGSEEIIDGTQPKVSGQRKTEDFYTFLVMGRDTGGGGNTDTMLLVSYNVTDQKLNVMSLPRDTMVNVPWDIKKLNSVYNYYGGGDKGIAAIKTQVSELVGFVPDYDVVIEWEAVGRLVDAIGGVYFDVPFDMDYEDFTQDLYIHLKKGYQKLDGEGAMGLIRWRHNNSYTVQYPNGDLGRIQTQQAFLKAVIEQSLQMKNATKIMEFSRIFSENVQTDLSVQNLFWLGKAAILGGLSMDNVNFVTMPNKGASVWSRTVRNYQSYVVPKVDELLELVNESFNPFVKDVTENEIDVMIVNSDGTLSATSGKVADTKATTKPESNTEKPAASQSPAPSHSVSPSTEPNHSETPAETPSSPSPAPEPPQESQVPEQPPEEDTVADSEADNGTDSLN